MVEFDLLEEEETAEDAAKAAPASGAAAGRSKPGQGVLAAAIQQDRPIPELSSEFAKAYPALGAFAAPGGAYALVFDNQFPVRMDAIRELLELQNPAIQRVLDGGKTPPGGSGEHYAAVLEKPVGITLGAYISARGALSDVDAPRFIEKISYAVIALHEVGVVHGCINPDTIYYDQASDRLMLKECISGYCGYAQLPAFESIDQITCHPAAKGDGDFADDYFALGMVALCVLTGRRAFDGLKREQVLQIRMEKGSCDEVVLHEQAASRAFISGRMEVLLKGLLTDHRHDRWNAESLRKWIKRQEVSFPISKLHRQAAAGLMFEEKEYVSRKYLAHAMFQKWDAAKKSIRIQDVSRWLQVSAKLPQIAEMLDRAYGHLPPDMLLTDERLARVLMILDPEGPVRYKQFSGHIQGFGTYLAWCSMKADRKGVQQIAAVLAEGMAAHWIDLQPNPRDYGFSMLGWSPSKFKQYVHKTSLGFGMERCLYDLNPSLPCQSQLVQSFYASNLRDLLEALEKFSGDKNATDPVDRHIAAFISSRLNLTDDIRIKALKNFPHVGKNPQVLMVGLLTVAQNEAHLQQLPKLAAWMETRLSTLLDKLHSKGIRRETQGKIRHAVKEGKMSTLFKVVSDPVFARRDLYGFHEARQQYRSLVTKINHLGHQSNIERVAYQRGLRISVGIAYLVCTVTALYLMLKSS